MSLFNDDFRIAMTRDIPHNSVHLIVTSPPYNVEKEYEEGQSFSQWKHMMKEFFYKARSVLVPGGRVAVNVAGVDRKPYRPLHHYLGAMAEEVGLLMRGEIIWDKAASVGTSTAWGSFAKASNPVLRDVHEYILVWSKDDFKKPGDSVSGITNEDFVSWTKSVWNMPTESAKRIGHPAPFPLNLPTRLIQLYTAPGDVVLDPFMGSGTTGVACARLDREFIGIEMDEQHFATAKERIARES